MSEQSGFRFLEAGERLGAIEYLAPIEPHRFARRKNKKEKEEAKKLISYR